MPTETPQDTPRPNDPEVIFGLVRAAIDPKPDAWYKETMGTGGPGFLELLRPNSVQANRYKQADELKRHVQSLLLETAVKELNAPKFSDVESQYPGTLKPTESQMMAGPQREVAPSNIDQALAPTGQTPAIGLDIRPGVSQGQASFDPLNFREQPMGHNPLPSNLGPFGMSPYQDPYAERQLQPPQYQPPVMGPGPRVVNPDARINPVQQGALGAYQHQQSLRPNSAGAQSGDIMKYEQGMARGVAAFKEVNKRDPTSQEMYDLHKVEAERYAKSLQPGTVEGQKATHEAEIAKIEALNRPGVLQATIDEKKARATWETRQALDSADTFVERLKHLKSQTAWNDAQAGRLGQQVFNLQAKAILDNAAASFQGMKFMWGADKLDDAGIRAYMQSYMNTTAKDLALQGVPPNTIQGLLGITPDKMTITPGNPVVPNTTPPVSGMTGSITPSVAPPPAQSIPVPPDAREELLKLQKSMAEGEIREYKGQKVKKQDGKLGPWKE